MAPTSAAREQPSSAILVPPRTSIPQNNSCCLESYIPSQGQAPALRFQPTSPPPAAQAFWLLLLSLRRGRSDPCCFAGSSAPACFLPSASLAEFCAGCCLTKQHDAVHWHCHLATEPQAAPNTLAMFALQVIAVWLEQQTNNVEIQAEVASNNHLALKKIQDSQANIYISKSYKH